MLNPESRKAVTTLILKVKSNRQNEEIPILIDYGGPVYKDMILDALDNKKEYSSTMKDINLETSRVCTKEDIIGQIQKRYKQQHPTVSAEDLWTTAPNSYKNTPVKSVSLFP